MLISKEEVKKLKKAGLSLAVIARTAGVSRARIDVILKGNKFYPSKRAYEYKRNERRRKERQALKVGNNAI